jgi:hypothetical protein
MHSQSHTNRLLTSIIASMVALTALAQGQGDRPKLVVGIMIDQLRSDYIELLQNHFGHDGFNRLLRDGAYFENVDFGIPNPDIASATAVVFTGSYPYVNGIPSAMIYDSKQRLPQFVLNDPTKIGNFTSETFSPVNLRVSTIADELRIDGDAMGYVYAVSPDPQQAIIMAGHAGNSAVWISDATGKWATTTFYKDVPPMLQIRNYQNSLSSRLDTMRWIPSLPISQYVDVPVSHLYPFKYTFTASERNRYRKYKQSGLVNEEVTSVAVENLKSLALGKRGQTDMLNVAYTAAPYSYAKGDNKMELEDTYIKLDRQLSRLLDAIDATVGLRNTLVFVAPTGYFDDGQKADAKFRIPTGEFKPERAISLLNMYLMAIYGNGQWVDGYCNRSFFLNHKLIKDKNVSLTEIRRKSSDFLRQMSGICGAYTFEDAVSNNYENLGRAMVPAYCGDVSVEVNPGWDIVETQGGTQTVTHVNGSAVSSPAFILSPQVRSQHITSPIDASILAPTVSRLLRIRSPNAASGKPYSL